MRNCCWRWNGMAWVRGCLVPAVSVAAALVPLSACFFPDYDALHEKLVEQCHVTFGGVSEACMLEPDGERQQAAYRQVFDHGVARSVRTAEQQQCLLTVPCRDDDEVIAAPALLTACLATDDADGDDGADVACTDSCEAEATSCGEDCAALTIERCLAQRDGCLDGCG